MARHEFAITVGLTKLMNMLRRLRTNPHAPQATLPAGAIVHAVGDIHGRSDLLDDVFNRIDRDLQDFPDLQAVEVYLGDYVDRGPDSCGVIDRLIARSRDREIMPLRGNHDAFLEEMLEGSARLGQWQQLGGLETMLSYGVMMRAPSTRQGLERMHKEWCAAVPHDHREFFARLQTSYTIGGYFFVHAGVRPGVALDRQSEEDLMWIRDEFHRSKVNHGKIVVHGHSPVVAPEFCGNRINIDTCAYASGELTCLRLVGSSQEIVG